jgi:hypothetical protein
VVIKRIAVALLVSAAMAHAGQSVKLAWDASVDSAVVGYAVYYGPAAGNYTNRLDAGTALTLATPALDDGTYYFSVTSRDTNGVESDFANVVSTNLVTVTAPAPTPPSITSQPNSMTTTPGSSATFTVSASGTAPMSYQWQFNSATISGATASAFIISSVQSNNAGIYNCTVANSAGTATSANASLAVTASGTPPKITTQPRDVSTTAGSPANFSVVATGTSLFYQWRRNGVPLSDGGNLSGTQSPNLSLSTVSSADDNNYCVVVSNSFGSVTSIYCVLNVSNAPTAVSPSISSQPISQTVNVGASASFTVTSSGTSPFSYQWQFNGNAMAGATNSICTIASAQTNNAGTYTCTVANSAGSVTSSAATLTVNVPVTAPSIVTQPSSLTVDPGAAATFTITANGTSPGYQWQFNGVAINGATGSTYTVWTTQSTNVGTYSCSVSNAAGSVTSADAMLSIATYITSSPASQTVNATARVSFTVGVGGTSTNSFQWMKNGSPISGATNATYSIASALRADAATYTASVTGNRTVTSSPAVLTVIDPVFYQQPANTNVLVGQTASFTTAATGTSPIRYQWWVVKPGAAAASVAGATNTTLTLQSTKRGDAGTYYCVASNGATNQSATAVLGVYSKQSQMPTSTASPGAVTLAATVNITVAADGSPILTWTDSNFSLQSAGQLTGPWTTIVGATSPYTNGIAVPNQYYRLIQ